MMDLNEKKIKKCLFRIFAGFLKKKIDNKKSTFKYERKGISEIYFPNIVYVSSKAKAVPSPSNNNNLFFLKTEKLSLNY